MAQMKVQKRSNLDIDAGFGFTKTDKTKVASNVVMDCNTRKPFKK